MNKPIESMSESEKDAAIHSARYLLEDLNERGKELLADLTGLPIGVIAAAFNNIFLPNEPV